MIDFSCIECKGTSSTFNERLGEMICDDCGLPVPRDTECEMYKH